MVLLQNKIKLRLAHTLKLSLIEKISLKTSLCIRSGRLDNFLSLNEL